MKDDFEKAIRHDETTARMRDDAKDIVAFYLAIEQLRDEGVVFPSDITWTTGALKRSMLNRKIGIAVTQSKGLTLDDASPSLKKGLLKEPKEVRDWQIGLEYFDNFCEKQKKRVLDEDVNHVSFYSHYNAPFNYKEVIEKIKAREKSATHLIQTTKEGRNSK